MRKWKWLSMLLSGIMLLTSCSLRSARVSIFDDSDRKADARFEKILKAISNKDADALRVMFSKQALSDSTDFENSLQYLFAYVQGSIGSYIKPTGSCGGTEEMNGSKHRKKVDSTYVLTTSEQEYHIAISEYTIDTVNPDNVGVYSFCIISSKDYRDSKFVYRGNGKVGINIGQ